MNHSLPLNAERVRELLSYDPETGVLTWRVTRGRMAPAGSIAGTNGIHGYRQLIICGERHKSHRVAWLITHGEWPAGDIDHINGIRDDNRLCNLRVVTRAQNMQNQRFPRRGTTSGLLGVSFHKRIRKWAAHIRVGAKTLHIGYFDEPEQAHQAYLEKKREVHPFGTI